jgi:hypothetical protein
MRRSRSDRAEAISSSVAEVTRRPSVFDRTEAAVACGQKQLALRDQFGEGPTPRPEFETTRLVRTRAPIP